LTRHASDDITDAAPVVEASVQPLEFWLTRLECEEIERGTQELAASV